MARAGLEFKPMVCLLAMWRDPAYLLPQIALNLAPKISGEKTKRDCHFYTSIQIMLDALFVIT